MVSVLEVIPDYVLHWIVRNGTERKFNEGEVLLTGGAENASLFVVLDGVFAPRLHDHGDSGVDHAGPGSLLGETSFFGGGEEPVTIVAVEPSLVLEISRSQFQDKLDHDHEYAADFYRALLQTLSRKLHLTTVKRMTVGHHLQNQAPGNPVLQRAKDSIEAFKQEILLLDKEALRSGGISEDRYRGFFGQATEMMLVCHETLGHGSHLPEPVRQHLGARLQAEMLPYLMATETADRFYSKPRGYAGDFVAIHRIYHNVAGGAGRLGHVMDRMFLDMPPSRAVRNRRALIAKEIIATVRARGGAPTRVLCLASGPASEVFDAFSELEDRNLLKVTLMDIDLQALAFVDEARAQRRLNGQITLVNENLVG